MEQLEAKLSSDSLSPLQSLIIAGAQKPEQGCIPFVVVPTDYDLKSLEPMLEKPNRIENKVNLLTSDSFIKYINRFVDPRTVIFADQTRTRVTAILDYHETNSDPEWTQHRAIYDCPQSDPWKEWDRNNKSTMDQLKFAEFIEARISDIAPIGEHNKGPSGTELLAMVLAFQETRKSEFKAVRRLQDGTFNFAFSDEKSGGGNASLPEILKLSLPVFHNGDYYAVDARLRYRLRDGDLSLWYELIEPKNIIEAAFKTVVANIGEQLKGTLLLDATAP